MNSTLNFDTTRNDILTHSISVPLLLRTKEQETCSVQGVVGVQLLKKAERETNPKQSNSRENWRMGEKIWPRRLIFFEMR